jgi:hypothetical protein
MGFNLSFTSVSFWYIAGWSYTLFEFGHALVVMKNMSHSEKCESFVSHALEAKSEHNGRMYLDE